MRMLPQPALLLQEHLSQNYDLIHFYKRKVLISKNNANHGSILITALSRHFGHLSRSESCLVWLG